MPSSGGKTCARSEEHTSELQSHDNLVCRLLLETKQTESQPHSRCSAPLPLATRPRGHGRGPLGSLRKGAAAGGWRPTLVGGNVLVFLNVPPPPKPTSVPPPPPFRP